jgi:uncharacterized membrane protein
MSLNRNTWLAITLTFVLAGLFFVLISGGAEAVDYKHEVTIDPSQQEGEPEETLSYTLTINNEGTEDDTYSLGVSSTVPTGWSMYVLPNQISISDESTGTVTLYVEIGNRTNAQGGNNKQFTIYCQSAGESSNNETTAGSAKVTKVYGTSLSSGATQLSVDPNNDATFTITVINDKGNTEDTITFTETSTGTTAWSFTIPGSISLDPDESATVTFSVTPDIEALAGLKSINFYANSEDDETAYSITVTVRVNQLPALEVAKVGSSASDIEAGKRVSYSFMVTNKGNAVDSFDISVITEGIPVDWEASVDTDEISSLGVGDSVNLTDVLVVKAPQDAVADVEATIQVKISSQENTSIFKTFTSRSTVLQNYDPKITIVGGDTQSADPEAEVTYNIKIENEGNGEDEISLSLAGSNSTWGTLGESSFTLEAGANTTTTLRVTAPADTTAQNGYKITMRATSEDETTTKSRDVFLNVNEIYEVSVFVSGDSTQSGDPGDQLTYSISVKNKGNSDDTVALSLEGDKASWGSIVEDLDLEQGETKTINLTVNIDDDAIVGDNDIIVRGASEDNPEVNDTGTVKVSVNKQFKVDVVVSSQSGDPGSTITYDVRIQNDGTGVDTFSVSIDDYPEGWAVDPVSFQVEDVPAGGEEIVELNVTIRSGENNKAFMINLTASSDEARKENPPKYVNTTVSIITVVNQEYWIEFDLDNPGDINVDATVGIPTSVTFDVVNKGTDDDVVSMSAESPAGWTSVSFSSNYVSVVEGGQESVSLFVTVPEDTADQVYDIVVTGVSDCDICDTEGAKSNYDLTFKIDVTLARGVVISADVVSVSKLPGTTANFTIDLKNTGDGADTIILSILDDDLSWASLNRTQVSLEKEKTGSVTVSVTLPTYDLDTLTNQERTALQATNYGITIKAKSAGDLSQSDNVALTTVIGQIYGAKIEVIGDNVVTSYPSTETDFDERTEKFTFKLTNTGNKQDTISDNIIATQFPDEWAVELYQASTCSSTFSGSVGAGQSKYLYLCATPDQDSDIGNYTILTEFSPNGGTEPAETVSVALEVASPRRSLAATAIDSQQEIYPEYEGSSSQNSVKFKVKLDNTGSNVDKYIPEVESTLEDDWTVTFWQDSGKTQSWSSSGVSIDDGELDDLWVFVEVADDADEGNETIEISIRDEEDDPSARGEVLLTVVVQRPELTLTTSDIQLEIDGAVGNATTVKEEDTVVVLVEVDNTGTADADDVRVEVFYYPKKSPTSQTEIDDLVIAGFVMDEAKNTYIYTLYDKEANIKSGSSKSIASDDWIIKGGEWYVEVRADYDEGDSNGKILEPNENNNDARYTELLRVKPDLGIDSMRIDSKYAGYPPAQVPNIDDTVTFTVSVTNSGAADVRDARLYITADTDSESGVTMMERSNKEYVKFDVDASETTDVRFRWKATEDEWSSFRAEINPVCDDYEIQEFECESEGDGFSSETDRMFDELNRYANNEYPTTGVFQQSDADVLFAILPDFKIKKVTMEPRDPEVDESVEITVTIENIGNSDWQIGMKPLTVVFEDGTGTELTTSVGESINKDDSVELKFTWIVPDEDKDSLFLTFTIDAGSGSFEIKQCNTCDDTNSGDGKDNDEYTEELPVVLSAVLGEIEFITTLTERDLVRGVPLIVPVIGLIGLVALAIPLLIYRRRGGREAGKDDEEESEEDGEEDQVVAPPAKIGVAIVSTIDGKTANVKVPSNMPVNKLLQNCVGKFPLPHANFAVMLNGVAVDINLSLIDAGLTDGCQVDLVPLE